jgi:uroporphyrinogen decarboxylase
MNSKERVHAALKRQPVDRVPVFMWFHPGTAAMLAKVLELPREHVGEAMGNDVRQAWVNNNHAMEGIVHENDGETHVDFWGIQWVKEGPFNQIAKYPLAGASREKVLTYRFPREHKEELLRQMEPVVQAGETYFIGADTSPCVFEMYWRLRGMEDALLEMAADPDVAGTLFERCADFAVELGEEACRRFKLDWLWTGDDVASQSAMMMSPDSWRRMVKPHLKRCLEPGKKRGLWTAYHCCGAIRPIIGDLIEIGLDVLNPIQCNCAGMEPLELKKEFGAKLAFMGGVDTQGVLPHGTADEVRKATARLIEGMTAGGGGFILAASHTIPPETPLDNIFAMYHEAGHTREMIFDRAAEIRANLNRR